MDVFDPSMSATHNPEEAAADLNLYPNPCHDALNIKWLHSNIAGDFEVSIYSVSGQLMTRSIPVNQSVSLDNIPEGVYFLQFRSGGDLISKVFVKE